MTTTARRRAMDATTPAPVDAAPILDVLIGDPEHPGQLIPIRLRWLCPIPTCRRPRGEPRTQPRAYHDAAGAVIAQAEPHVWNTPCGHVRLTAELLAEAAHLAAEPHTAPAQATLVPRPRTPKDRR